MVIKMVWISKAVFSLCPYFRIVLIRAEHTLASSEPVVACQEVDVVVQGIVSRETAEPALVVKSESCKLLSSNFFDTQSVRSELWRGCAT